MRTPTTTAHCLTALVVSALVAFGTGTPAAAAQTTASGDEGFLVQVRADLDKYGVPTSAQDDLIAKFERGEPWDSIAGGSIVSTEALTVDGETVTVDRFKDGSIVAYWLESPAAEPATGKVTPMAVSNCSVTYSSNKRTRNYRDCTARATSVLFMMSFDFDYKITVAADYVTVTAASLVGNPRNAFIRTIGATNNGPTLVVNRRTAQRGAPANARLSTTSSHPIAGSSTIWVQVNIPIGDTTLAYTTYQF